MKPKILVLDIETSPIVAYSWGIHDQNIGLIQVLEDWSILSFAAKWLGDPANTTVYRSTAGQRDLRDDKKLLKTIWKLIDEADMLLTQNGNSFDIKKLNARFAIHGMQPPSSFKKIDTKLIAKKHFNFTSNSLEYLTNKFCKKYRKLKHGKFPGFSLWIEYLKNNKEAQAEMKTYNIHDVLSLEELYQKLAPWDNSVSFIPFLGDAVCKCGSKNFTKNGYAYTASAKYQRLKCSSCGHETRDKKNLIKVSKSNTAR